MVDGFFFHQWATLQTKPEGGGGLVLDERGEKKTKFAQTLVVDKATGGILMQIC